MTTGFDNVDRDIIRATQAGLPLTNRPYDQVGNIVGVDGAEVRVRMAKMLRVGAIRRIGIVPNHYALGLTANGMTVWDVHDDQVKLLGQRVGSLECVSNAYLRPRHLPDWPYNLFAMVHGHSKAAVETKADEIRTLLGSACRSGEVLYSTRILKKTGFRSKS